MSDGAKINKSTMIILAVTSITLLSLFVWWDSSRTQSAITLDDDEEEISKYTLKITNSSDKALDLTCQTAYVDIFRYHPETEGNFADIEDFTQEDLNDIQYSDFKEVKSNLEHDNTFVLDDEPAWNIIYVAVATCSGGNGYTEVTVFIQPLSYYEGGVIEIEMLQKPDKCVIGAISDDGDATYNASITTADVWTATVYNYNDQEELTSLMGYRDYLDFDAITSWEDLDTFYVYPMIRLDFNTTTNVNSTLVDVSGSFYYDTNVDNGNYDVYFIQDVVSDTLSITFDMDSSVFGAGGGSIGIDDFEFATARIGGALTSIDTT